jgi:hypothetical protein
MLKLRSEKDFGSSRYGFGGVRTYLTKAMRVRADRALLRAANEAGMTAADFRAFSESKAGRWYGDHFISRNGLTLTLKGRRTIDLAREYIATEAR